MAMLNNQRVIQIAGFFILILPRSSHELSPAASPMHQRPPGPGCEWGPQRAWSHDPTPWGRGRWTQNMMRSQISSSNIIKQISHGFTIFISTNMRRWWIYSMWSGWWLQPFLTSLKNIGQFWLLGWWALRQNYAGGQMHVLQSHSIHQAGWEIEYVSNHPNGVAMSPSFAIY